MPAAAIDREINNLEREIQKEKKERDKSKNEQKQTWRFYQINIKINKRRRQFQLTRAITRRPPGSRQERLPFFFAFSEYVQVFYGLFQKACIFCLSPESGSCSITEVIEQLPLKNGRIWRIFAKNTPNPRDL
jgi:hypothetical protein